MCPIFSLVSSLRNGDGASSKSFWLFLWIEQSRSPRYTVFPCLSARIWNSICLGFNISFSMYMSSLPNAALASAFAVSKALTISSLLKAFLIPLPPPPAEALIRTGYPILSASSTASLAVFTIPLEPGTTGISFSIISFLAACLSPIFLIISEDGPMKQILFSSHFFTKSGFSDKNPNPG